MRPMRCAEVQELACDLALDLLTGEERAAALAHLEGCAPCRAEVASLTDVGEALLTLTPGVEPSPGFADRVVDRIAELGEPPPARRGAGGRRAGRWAGVRARGRAWGRAHRPGRRPRWRLRPVVVAAMAAVATATAVAGLVLGPGSRGPDDAVAAAMRTADGEVVGHASLRDADPAVVTLDLREWVARLDAYRGAGPVTYRLAVDRGGDRELYALPLDEPGPWRITLGEDADDVTALAVVDGRGRAWCGAQFPGG